MPIMIIGGHFGHGEAILVDEGLTIGETVIPFADMTELYPEGLEMVHGFSPKANKGMGLALLFGGRPAWAIAQNAWTGDVLEVRFVLRTSEGNELHGRADSASFVRLKEGFFGKGIEEP